MFKKAKVVMLPTNEKAQIYKDNGTLYNDNKPSEFSDYKHLYITSNEEIKEGDWFYDKVLNVVTNTDKYVDFKYINQTDNCEKIISSTNPKLIINIGGDTLPQPSKSFIDKYIEEYNKGNVINEVMVEYEVNSKDIIKFGARGEHVKVNSKDNTITIKKIKDSWTREEVVKLIKEYHASFASYPTMNLDLRDNWISKNL